MLKLIDYLLPSCPAFMDTVREFYNTVSKDDTVVLRKYIYNGNIFKKLFTFLANKFLFRLSYPLLDKNNHYFAMIMGLGYGGCLNVMLFKKHTSVYLFDVWPNTYPFFEYFFRKMKFEHVFLSSKSTVNYFNWKIVNTKFHWIPEGIDVNTYFSVDYSMKNIDILQFGRKYEYVHFNIMNSNVRYSYLYQKGDDKIFPSNFEFKKALAHTKVSLCFPAEITHPEKAQGISTMTARYLQSMASKCLVVGIMPEEMKELFDYMPIVEIDIENPYNHIEYILEHYDTYYDLIEKNYQYVKNFHSWKNRWEFIKSEILNVK